jgi:O-antigen/teichoic acid export membrane protein
VQDSPVVPGPGGRLAALLSAHGTYYAAMGIAGGVGLAKSVGYGLILAPTDFGRLSLVNSVALFLLFGISRGTLESAALELPRLYGLRQNTEAAGLIRASLRRLYLECGVAVAAALAALALGVPAVTVCLAVPLAATTAILSLVMTDARSRGEMGRYGKSVLGRVMLASLIGVPAAAVFGLKGAVLGESIAQALLIAWLLRAVGPAGPAGYRGPAEARARGWKMMGHQFLQLLQQNGDKWIISAALGAAALGQYSFAGIFLVAVSLIHAIAYQQVGPAALRSLAEGEGIDVVLRRVQRAALVLGAGVAVLGVLAGGLYWFGLSRWFSAYREGFQLFPWIVLTAVFQVMNQLDWIVATGTGLGAMVRWDLVSTGIFLVLGLGGMWIGLPLVYFAILACLARAAALAVSFQLARATAQAPASP